ncbi:MAG: hypothetical protein ACK5LO_17125 [Leucobacter sp.]
MPCEILKRLADLRLGLRLGDDGHRLQVAGHEEPLPNISRARRCRQLHPVVACEGADDHVVAGLHPPNRILIGVSEMMGAIPSGRGDRRQYRGVLEVEEAGKKQRKAVVGYDFTF